MSDFGPQLEPPRTALPDPATADNVVYEPSPSRLRELAGEDETTSEFGSPAYVSEHRSRNADRTANTIDDAFGPADYRHAADAYRAARSRKMVCLDRQVGRHPETSYVARLFVPRAHARIALAWGNLFETVADDADDAAGVEPDFYTVQLPEHDEVAIRVFPDDGVTVVLGSDYTGEAKKSVLRLFMYEAKRRGGLGLHAGTKRIVLPTDGDEGNETETGTETRTETETGTGTRAETEIETETVGQVFLGLSGTGKSTLTAHGLDLDPPASASMLQDDVVTLLPDGTVAGSEGSGLYVKTIGLSPDEQPAIYGAATAASAVMENVDVADDGTVDFDSDRYTANARAVVQRDDLTSAADEIDLPAVDQVFFITRNPAMPPIAKLSPAEAAAAFMLGESVETSAGDPANAGESIRVVGTNPFIVGSEGEEGNRFRDLIADLDVDCFVLNTGSVGDRDVGVSDTVAILRAVSRGTVEWRHDPATDLTVPASVPDCDVARFDVADALDDHEAVIERLRAERRAYLGNFEDLDDDIRDAVY